MLKLNRPIVVLGMLTLIGGCGKMGGTGTTGSTPPPPATTQPVAVNNNDNQNVTPQTQPASPEVAAPVGLLIGNKQFWFPRAILRLTVVDGKVNARLTTDDPKEALEPNYQGNSFDLEMPLDISDVSDLNSATWAYRSQASQTANNDSPHGIFLNGQQKRVYPQYAQAFFAQHGSDVTVKLEGQFLMYENATRADQPFALPQVVNVQGELEASVVAK